MYECLHASIYGVLASMFICEYVANVMYTMYVCMCVKAYECMYVCVCVYKQ